MFIAGCAKQPVVTKEPTEPVQDVEKTTVKSTPTKTTPTETVETQPETESEPAKVPSKAIQALLEKHVGRVTSLRYMYQDQTMKPEEWETWIKDDKMHVRLRELDNVRGDVYIDHIYMDLSTKVAQGYCEMHVYRCADPNSPVDVTFQKYYRKSPIDWIESVTYAEKETEEQMQQRTVWKIKYTEGAKTVAMWVDDYYGIPVKVRVTEGSAVNEYIFEDIAINSVEDSDLQHGFVQTSYNN
jgi:hypothetical protein